MVIVRWHCNIGEQEIVRTNSMMEKAFFEGSSLIRSVAEIKSILRRTMTLTLDPLDKVFRQRIFNFLFLTQKKP